MGTVDVKNGQRFERRIGRRIDVDPIDVTFFVPQTGRFRKKVAPHEVPGRIENVSITGAAIVGPSSLPWQPGDRIVVRSRGADNVVVVRHRQPTGAGHRFGVELTRSAATLKRQIQLLLDPHLAPPAADEQPSGPVLGLKRADAPRLGGLPVLHPPAEPPLDAPAAASAEPPPPPPPVVDAVPPTPPPVDLPPPEPVAEPVPVLDLTGPEPVLDLTDAVMAPPPPEPVPVAQTEASPEGPPPVAEAVLAATVAAPPRPDPDSDSAEPDADVPAATEAPAPEVPAPAAPTPDHPAAVPDAGEPTATEPAATEPVAAEHASAEHASAEADRDDERAVAPRAPSPHLPHSPGRQVLDEVFGLMQD